MYDRLKTRHDKNRLKLPISFKKQQNTVRSQTHAFYDKLKQSKLKPETTNCGDTNPTSAVMSNLTLKPNSKRGNKRQSIELRKLNNLTLKGIRSEDQSAFNGHESFRPEYIEEEKIKLKDKVDNENTTITLPEPSPKYKERPCVSKGAKLKISHIFVDNNPMEFVKRLSTEFHLT